MRLFASSSDPIEGLFGNMHTLLPLLIAGGAWIMATLRKVKQKQAAATPPAVDEAERTRRVQEDVRRKIAERRSRYTEEEETPPAPPVRSDARPAMGEGWRGSMVREIPPIDSFGGPNRRAVKAAPVPVPAPVRSAGLDDAAVRERQRWLAAAQASDLNADGPRFAADAALAPLAAPPPEVSPWLEELREPAGVRRAIVLREILGPPVGLR